MAYLTITSANSVYMLAIVGLFPAPQQLTGFSADAAFATEAITSVEVVMGVDGNLSAGWIPVEKKQTISIMPDSPSAAMFDAWYAAQEGVRELYWASASITIPSISLNFICTKGVLSTYTPIAEVRKTLAARQFGITWQTILPAPV